MGKLTKIFLFSLILIFAAGIQSAHAIAQLKLSDGTSTLFIVDGNPLGNEYYVGYDAGNLNHFKGVDIESAEGAITYFSGTLFNNFVVNTTVGITYPVPGYGSLENPEMHLHTDFITYNGESGIFDAWFSEVGFGITEVPTLKMFKTTNGGAGEGLSYFDAHIDSDNVLYGIGTTIGEIGDEDHKLGPGSWDGADIGSYLVTMPYSLTTHAHVDFNGTDGPSGFNLVVTTIVPEPVSSVLFLVGGVALGLRRYRLKK